MTPWDDLLKALDDDDGPEAAADLDESDDLDDAELDSLDELESDDLDDAELDGLDELASDDGDDLDDSTLEALTGAGALGMGLLDDDDDDEDEDEDDDELSGDDLDDSIPIHCPYCGREVEHIVDHGGGSRQSYVEDCEICCQPMAVTVYIEGGVAWAEAKALDE